MPELTDPEDTADSYPHCCPQNIPQTKIGHIFIFICPYIKGLTWWITLLWSVLKLMVSAKTDLWRKCCARTMLIYPKEKPVSFSQIKLLFKTTESLWKYGIMEATCPQTHLAQVVHVLFWQSKNQSTKIYQVNWIIPNLFSASRSRNTNVEHVINAWQLQLSSYTEQNS